MGLLSCAKVSPTRPESLSPITWPSCWTSLEDVVSKWALVCGGSCLWVHYNYERYHHSHWYHLARILHLLFKLGDQWVQWHKEYLWWTENSKEVPPFVRFFFFQFHSKGPKVEFLCGVKVSSLQMMFTKYLEELNCYWLYVTILPFSSYSG